MVLLCHTIEKRTGLKSLLLLVALQQAYYHSNAAELVIHLAQNIKSVLQECYGDKEAVTDELVDCILKPGLEVCRLKHIVSPVVITTKFSCQFLHGKQTTLEDRFQLFTGAAWGSGGLPGLHLLFGRAPPRGTAAADGLPRQHPVGRGGSLGAHRAGARLRRL